MKLIYLISRVFLPGLFLIFCPAVYYVESISWKKLFFFNQKTIHRSEYTCHHQRQEKPCSCVLLVVVKIQDPQNRQCHREASGLDQCWRSSGMTIFYLIISLGIFQEIKIFGRVVFPKALKIFSELMN